ncbi:MAG: DUF4405 domain-containing protein [Deltaproteobacteria bacterium]|nr:DUF4405 domain-containing protein [Deltaproteobacteria bacterium]
MKLRRLVSLLLFFSFLLLVLTSLILYVTPQGRVAFWADWRLWGLDKEQWGYLHINLGLLFLLAGGLHTLYNWRPIMSYMGRTAARVGKKSLRELFLAAVICLVFALGTLFKLPPFSVPLALNAKIKDRAALTLGIPPYGHAELSSLAEFTQRTRLDLEQALESLRKAGLVVTDGKQTMIALAQANQTSPQKIFQLMRPLSKASGLPEFPPPGFGRMTLVEIAEVYKLSLPTLLQRLKAVAIESDGQQKFMELAQSNNRSPAELYQLLRKTEP